MPPFAIPVGIPVSATTFQRYDQSTPDFPPQWSRYGLEYGNAPTRIPRLWNMSLGSLANESQWGYQDANDQLRLPPPVIPVPNRTTLSSVAMGVQAKRFADTQGIPAIFVGWNPANGRV